MTTPMKEFLVTSLRIALVLVLLIAFHAVLARVLDEAGLVERLLSPSGFKATPIALLGLLFFVLRLTLIFVAPGVVLALLILRWPKHRQPG